MTVITEQQTSRKPGIASQQGSDIAVARALEPVLQSALGVMRESAGLLYHIAGLGIALVSDPKLSRPRRATEQPRPVAPEGMNVIRFPGSKCQAAGRRSNRIRS